MKKKKSTAIARRQWWSGPSATKVRDAVGRQHFAVFHHVNVASEKHEASSHIIIFSGKPCNLVLVPPMVGWLLDSTEKELAGLKQRTQQILLAPLHDIVVVYKNIYIVFGILNTDRDTRLNITLNKLPSIYKAARGTGQGKVHAYDKRISFLNGSYS